MSKEETSVTDGHVKDADDVKYQAIPDNESNILICYKRPLSRNHQVYLGKQTLENGSSKQVAIKLVTPDEDHRREIEILLKLPAHVNTVKYICTLESKQPPAWYIVMELCGENLYQWVGQSPDLTIETKKTVLLHIITGLCHIHQQKILHRDLKPQNLLLSRDGFYIKVCDFGLSKQIAEIDVSVTKSAKHIGTEGWGSPESYTLPQEDTKKVTERMSQKSDVFSAGLIFSFVMSNGKHPCGEDFSAWALAIKSETPINVSDLAVGSDVTPCEEILIKHLISNMLSKNPAERPNSEEVLSHALFWDTTKKIDFLIHVHRSIRRTENLVPKVRIQKDWTDRLEEKVSQKSSTAEISTTTLSTKVEAISKENEEPLFTLLNLVNDCYNEIDMQTAGDQPLFKTLESLWTYFSEHFPEVFVDIFHWYWKDLPENLSEEFRDRFGTMPPKNKLIPAIDDIRTRIDGRNVHISWNHISEEPVRYRVRAFCGDDELDAQVTKKREYILKDAKSSSSLRFTIYAENERGSRSPVRDPAVFTPPSKPEKVVATQLNSTIVVEWRSSNEDSISEYFVRIRQFKCPDGTAEDSIMKAKIGQFNFKFPLPSRRYTFNVYAVSPNGVKGPISDCASIETIPSCLCKLSATLSESSRSIKVTWPKPEDELVTYYLQTYRNGKSHESEVHLAVEEYEIEPNSVDDQYEFEVWAKSKFGIEGKKKRTNKISLPPEVIEDPKVSRCDQSLKLEWKPTKGDVEYRVQILSDGKILGNDSTRDTHYDFPTPIPTTSYRFKLWAKSKHDVDGPIVTLGPVTTALPVVQGLDVEHADGTLRLSWTKPVSQEVGKYFIQVFRRNIGEVVEGEIVESKTITNDNYQIRKTTPSMQYRFKIQALDSTDTHGETAFSKWITTAPAGVKKLTLQVDAATKDSMRASWEKVENHKYQLRTFRDGVKEPIVKCETNTLIFTAKPNSRYFVRIVAVNKEGIPGPPVQSDTTMLPPKKVTNIKWACEDEITTLSWDPSPQATMYVCEFLSTGTEEIVTKETDTTGVDIKTEPSKQYKFTVQAKNQYGVGGDLTEYTILTPPPAVKNLGVVYKLYKDPVIVFSWLPVTQAVKYRIELKKELRNKKEKTLITATTRNPNFDYRVGPSERYVFTVSAEDENEVASNPQTVDIDTPPLQVKITQMTYKNNKIILTWDKLDDPGVQYVVRTFTNDGGSFPERIIDKTTFEFKNPKGEYYFEVWAKNWRSVEGTPSRSHKLTTDPSPKTTTVDVHAGVGATDSVVTFMPSRYHSGTGVATVVTGDRALAQMRASSRVETADERTPLRGDPNEDEDESGCFGRMRKLRKSGRQRTQRK